MTITNSFFTGNSAAASGAYAFGGAVANGQTMTIANCSFTGNSAVAGPAVTGVFSLGQSGGGAIITTYLLTLSNSIVAGNEAVGGSGGYTLPFPSTSTPPSEVASTTVSGRSTPPVARFPAIGRIGGASAQGPGGGAFGGGIRNDFEATLSLSNSTVSGNLCQAGAGASGYAGGIAYGAGLDNERYSIAILTNNTISLNECVGGAGGGSAIGGLAVGAVWRARFTRSPTPTTPRIGTSGPP